MYTQQQLHPQEIADFSTHLTRLQEMIAFFQQQARRGQTPDPEPILKLMNSLIDLYDA